MDNTKNFTNHMLRYMLIVVMSKKNTQKVKDLNLITIKKCGI